MSLFGSFGASDRPATAPGGDTRMLRTQPLNVASHNTATRKCVDDIDFETIVALSRQFTGGLEVKNSERRVEKDLGSLRGVFLRATGSSQGVRFSG